MQPQSQPPALPARERAMSWLGRIGRVSNDPSDGVLLIALARAVAAQLVQ